MSAIDAGNQRQSKTNQANLTTCSKQNKRKPFTKLKNKDKENTRRLEKWRRGRFLNKLLPKTQKQQLRFYPKLPKPKTLNKRMEIGIASDATITTSPLDTPVTNASSLSRKMIWFSCSMKKKQNKMRIWHLLINRWHLTLARMCKISNPPSIRLSSHHWTKKLVRCILLHKRSSQVSNLSYRCHRMCQSRSTSKLYHNFED